MPPSPYGFFQKKHQFCGRRSKEDGRQKMMVSKKRVILPYWKRIRRMNWPKNHLNLSLGGRQAWQGPQGFHFTIELGTDIRYQLSLLLDIRGKNIQSCQQCHCPCCEQTNIKKSDKYQTNIREEYGYPMMASVVSAAIKQNAFACCTSLS